jgi:hypothetical protein
MFAYNIYRSYDLGLSVHHAEDKSDLVENNKIEGSCRGVKFKFPNVSNI